MTAAGSVRLAFTDVEVRAGGSTLVQDVTWTVRAGEHWALLGANGAGKSTLLRLAGAVRHPSSGRGVVLGETLGRVDLRDLRARIGVVDPMSRLPPGLPARDVVLTGLTGTVLLLANRLAPDADDRAAAALDLAGLTRLADRPVGDLSVGERARVRLARALVGDPELLLLDEPAGGLDLPGREDLVAVLESIASARPTVATVLVTHTLEELPRSTSHACLLRAGRLLATGPVQDVLTGELLSACFERPVRVGRADGRWSAWATAPDVA